MAGLGPAISITGYGIADPIGMRGSSPRMTTQSERNAPKRSAWLFQALGCIVQKREVGMLFHIGISTDQSELLDECDVAL